MLSTISHALMLNNTIVCVYMMYKWPYFVLRIVVNVRNVNALFMVEMHLAIKLIYRNPTFNNAKEKIQT